MDQPEDKQFDSGERLSSLEEDSWLWRNQLGALDSGNQGTEEKTEEQVCRLKELIVELKGNLIALNKGIVERQDSIDQLTKRKQKLLNADKGQAVSVDLSCATVIRKANAQLDLIDNDDVDRDAVEVFPEEVWEMILYKLSDPQDLRDCSKSCQLFDKILHPLKQTFLFIGIFPDLCSYLENDVILRCRSVCKGWNEGVDSFAENHPARFNPERPPQTNGGLFPYEFSNKSDDLRKLNFFKQMRHHPRNPFVGRAVNIRIVQHYVGAGYFWDYSSDEEDSDHNEDADVSEPDPLAGEEDSDDEDVWDSDDDFYLYDRLVDRDEPFGYGSPAPDYLPRDEAIGKSEEQQKQLFWQALLKFLRMFGKHIWHISFQCDRDFPFTTSQPSVFRFLTRKIFILAPNLRSLQIKGYLPRANRLILGPLPVAPKLETLQIEREWRVFMDDNPLKSSVAKTLIHARFQHLKQLRVDWATWKHIFKFNLDWISLTELYITNNHYLNGNGGIAKVKHLIPSRMPHLKKIGLNHHPVKCDFQAIMKIIIGLSARTNLQVFRLPCGIGTEQVLQTPIRLFAPPTLKTLEIDRAIMPPGDYAFLLRFPFLENLVVFFDEGYNRWSRLRVDTTIERQVLELESYMCQERVYESEIWELLPRLKSFTVGWDFYTREGYERIMSRKKNDLEK